MPNPHLCDRCDRDAKPGSALCNECEWELLDEPDDQ